MATLEAPEVSSRASSAPGSARQNSQGAASQISSPQLEPRSVSQHVSENEQELIEGDDEINENTPLDEQEQGAETGEDSPAEFNVNIVDEEPRIVDLAAEQEQQFKDQLAQKRNTLRESLLQKTPQNTSYYTFSKKETVVVDTVQNFCRQYTQLYPSRKELLILPQNEFGQQKFICTTIRPTQLPFKELYDYRSCAKFVSDYLSYELLEPAHEGPKVVPSPTYTLKMQSGNCFDFSVLLVSLLRGVGYDAYVVSGYASNQITLVDETRNDASAIGLPQPFSTSKSPPAVAPAAFGHSDGAYANDGTNSSSHPPSAAPNKPMTPIQMALKYASSGYKLHSIAEKYRVKPPRQMQSAFLAKMEKKRLEAEAKVAPVVAAQEPVANEVVDDDDDELKGLRVHAWVLVLPGRRDIAEPFFIEPTTGRVYGTEDERYLGVESVFSPMNYWVNMQTCYDGLKGISFNLWDNAKWEYVLKTPPEPQRKDASKSKPAAWRDEESDEDDLGDDEEHIAMPTPWPNAISLTREEFETRLPAGGKTTLFKNLQLENWAEYHRPDGMISRLTYFADDETGFNGEIREVFANRRDKLSERIRLPDRNQIHDFFDRGRGAGLQEHVSVNGKTIEMNFYPSARSDGLLKRLESPRKIIEFFETRDDRLKYRSVTFDSPPKGSDDERGPMIKMTEKFTRNTDVGAGVDPSKKTYFLKEEKIRVVYHRDEGRILSSFHEFKKPPPEQKVPFVGLSSSFEVNSLRKPLKKPELFALLNSLLRAEQICLQAVRGSEREVRDILQARQAEESEIVLNVSVFDTTRNQAPSEEEKAVHKGTEDETKRDLDLDYLSPFLINYPPGHILNREEALAVKDACIKSLKERLLERANIIQTRLDALTAEYQKRQAAFARNVDGDRIHTAEEFARFSEDALFSIRVHEKRLIKHKEDAPEKLIELDTRLRRDSRLQAAFV
ncbi:hypothetical protein SmJEL517_g04139 [Synchytrium microbalum]|uniref:Dynein regulatory complex subunit 7 n=1 Tax=Synchytrium microbalum TaxID=1806994 RepID=A0A507BZF9_9FUNG|nr:uncharacterized protein SmJEL517_g04139 [Synchytrium microbalum]TPX32812.1 hypothetical protein SmJEL517_g04139 [Synchytrium microbalum]